jgi:CheY-like chemotaxis protein
MKTILIVDDHADMRRLLTISAGNEYHVVEAEDGEGAFESVRRLRPDAVLLDIMMPGAMDGLQVLDAIRADPALKHIRVAMVTARGQAADLSAGKAHGADAYFVKPFSPLKLLGWLRVNLS